jgi:hypothetical protein
MAAFKVAMDQGLVRIGDKNIFERRESNRVSVRRSRLKLPSYRSMNAQWYIRPRTSLIGRNLRQGNFKGGAIHLNFLRKAQRLPIGHDSRRQCLLQLLEKPLVRGIVPEPPLAATD